MIPTPGFAELVLIFCVVLLFFGAKRLPEVASGMGKGIRDFKRALSGLDRESIQAAAETPPQVQAGAAVEEPKQLP